MSNIANDRDLQTFERALDLANGINVEKALCRVLAKSVAGVDHTCLDVPAQKSRRPAGLMTHDDDVNPHGLQIPDRIQQGLALTDRAGFLREFNDVRAQPARREGKAVSRSRAVFKEQVHHDLAAQGRRFLYRPGADLLESLGGIKNVGNFFSVKLPKAKQVLALPLELFAFSYGYHTCGVPQPAYRYSMTTSSFPSDSTRLTWTDWPGAASVLKPA